MDCYRDMRDVKRTFVEFIDHVPFYGMVVACNDDPILRRMLPQVRRRIVTYGTRAAPTSTSSRAIRSDRRWRRTVPSAAFA